LVLGWIRLVFLYFKCRCPFCRKNTTSGNSPEFCPECGSRELTRKNAFCSYQCNKCNMQLKWTYKTRLPLFIVRYCLNCGASLRDYWKLFRI
jgi:hypothetical protein